MTKFSKDRPLTDAEEAEIQAMIASDPDTPELTDEQLAEAKPFAEVFPDLAASIVRTRGKQKAPTKELISLRVDRDVLAAYRATGDGWQARMNAALKAGISC